MRTFCAGDGSNGEGQLLSSIFFQRGTNLPACFLSVFSMSWDALVAGAFGKISQF